MRLGAPGNSSGARFRAPAAALICVLALGLAACGSSDDSSDQLSAQDATQAKAILAVGSQLKQGYEDKDAAAICGLMDPQGVKAYFKNLQTCVKRLNGAFNQTDAVPDFSFDNVTVDGDTAVATADVGDGSTGNTIHFKKVGGKWMVDISPQSPESESGSAQDK